MTMDGDPPEQLPEVPARESSHTGNVPAGSSGSGSFDIGVVGGLVPVSLKYSAIRQLRVANPEGQDEVLGVLLGSYSRDVRIEHCVPLPVPPGSRASQAQTEE